MASRAPRQPFTLIRCFDLAPARIDTATDRAIRADFALDDAGMEEIGNDIVINQRDLRRSA